MNRDQAETLAANMNRRIAHRAHEVRIVPYQKRNGEWDVREEISSALIGDFKAGSNR